MDGFLCCTSTWKTAVNFNSLRDLLSPDPQSGVAVDTFDSFDPLLHEEKKTQVYDASHGLVSPNSTQGG